MPRRPRHEAPGAIHHVVAQGNGRGRIVVDAADADRLWEAIAKAADDHGWSVLAACLLGTHLHVMVRTEEANLGSGMRRLLGAYGRWFNLRHGLEGHLFRSPYWSTRVLSNDHAVAGVAYVALNPVRAGLCAHPADWRWSTYRETAGLEEATFARATGLVSFLGTGDLARGRAAFVALVEGQLSRTRDGGPHPDSRPAYLDEIG